MALWIAFVALDAAAQDGDGDGVSDAVDVCPLQADPAQSDDEGDGAGDACDLCQSPGDGTALFGPATNLGVTSGLPPLAADLDTDGDPDVILAVFGSIDWMENTGAGSFADPVALVTTGWWQVGALAVADLDDDSLPDLIASEESGFGLVYFAGQGAGSFAAEALIDADHTGGVLAADLDGDGDDDLCGAGSSSLTVWENQAGAVFRQVWVGEWSTGCHPADLDGDGDQDLLGSGWNGLFWLENLGGLAFGSAVPLAWGGEGVPSIATGDLDADGDLDVVAAGEADPQLLYASGTYWIANLGAGTFSEPRLVSDQGRSLAGAVDLDLDGDLDVHDTNCVVFLNDGTGAFVEQPLGSDLDAQVHVAVDLDLDGDADRLVQQVPGGALWRSENLAECFGLDSDADGLRDATELRLHGSDPGAPDSDGDGWTDAQEVFERGTSPAIVDTDADGVSDAADCPSFGPRRVFTQGPGHTFTVHSADLDADAAPEALAVTSVGLVIFPSAGDGLVETETLVPSAVADATALMSADPDLDGDLDVLAGTSAGVLFWENLGAGELAAPSSYTPESGELFEWADLDQSGGLDLVLGSVDLLKAMSEAGTGDAAVRVIDDGIVNPSSAHAIDLDGDGDLDLLSSSEGGEEVGFYEWSQGFGPRRVISDLAATAVAWVRGLDVDGDGDVDVVAAGSSPNRVVWFENVGGASFGPAREVGTPAASPVRAAGFDVDGDHDIDVVVLLDGSPSLAWFENRGASGFVENELPYDAAETLTALQAADLDGDGDLDLLTSARSYERVGWHENFSECLADLDADGLQGGEESFHGTDPLDADSDGGGSLDSVEVLLDGTDPTDAGDDDTSGADTDNDGIPDRAETLTGTDPQAADSDADGLTDGEELLEHHTHPGLADTDYGGASDGNEIADGTDPRDATDDRTSVAGDTGVPSSSEPVGPRTNGPGLENAGCGCAHRAPPPTWPFVVFGMWWPRRVSRSRSGGRD